MRGLVGPDQRLRPRSRAGGVPRGRGASTTRQRPRRPDQEPRDRLGRPAGRRQADPAGIASGPGREPLERDGQVGPALGRDQRMDLVDDQVLDRCASAPCQAAWLSSSDRLSGVVISRCGGSSRSLRRCVGRGVARPHADPAPGWSSSPSRRPDRLQRLGQVALDVVAEAPQRRDVDAPQAGRRASPPRAPGRAGRGSPGTRRASCPSRSARPGARSRPPRSAARPAPAPGSDPPGRPPRTSRGPGPTSTRRLSLPNRSRRAPDS